METQKPKSTTKEKGLPKELTEIFIPQDKWSKDIKHMKLVWGTLLGFVAGGNILSAVIGAATAPKGASTFISFYLATFPLTSAFALICFLYMIEAYESLTFSIFISTLILLVSTLLANLLGNTNVLVTQIAPPGWGIFQIFYAFAIYGQTYGWFTFLCCLLIGAAIAWSIRYKIAPHFLNNQ